MRQEDDSRLWSKVYVPARSNVPYAEHSDWLSDTAGDGNWYWGYANDWSTFIFYIRDPEISTLFKLRFPI